MLASSLALAGCAHLPSRVDGAGPGGEPLYPARTVGPGTTVTATIDAPIQDVFAFTVAPDVLPKVLQRYGPVPPVLRTQILHGPWDREGADRKVFIEGGGMLHEQITRFVAPRYFAYQIDQLDGTALGTFATRGVGTWIFTEDHGATRVEWTYSFEPRSFLTAPALAVFVTTAYRGYMRQALGIIRHTLEHDRSPRGTKAGSDAAFDCPL